MTPVRPTQSRSTATPAVFRYDAVATSDVGDRLELDGDEGRHAATVRRLRVGERLALTDGRGALAGCRVSAVGRAALSVEVVERSHRPRPWPELVVAQATARGGRDEAAVEAMTEVGVSELLGWTASRAVAQWSDRAARRWQSTADAAAKQSRRAWWPTVTGPVTTTELAQRAASGPLALVLHESATDLLTDLDLASVDAALLVVGPEGGVADDELDELASAGAVAVRLGDTVLRSSTAGTAALAVLLAATRWRSPARRPDPS